MILTFKERQCLMMESVEATNTATRLIKALNADDEAAAKKELASLIQKTPKVYQPQAFLGDAIPRRDVIGWTSKQFQDFVDFIVSGELSKAKEMIGLKTTTKAAIQQQTGTPKVTTPKVTTKLTIEEMEGILDFLHDIAVDEPEYDDLYQYFYYEIVSRDKIDLERMRASGAVEDYYGLLDQFIQKYIDDKEADYQTRKWLQKIAFKLFALEKSGDATAVDIGVLNSLIKSYKNVGWVSTDAGYNLVDSDTGEVVYDSKEDKWNV